MLSTKTDLSDPIVPMKDDLWPTIETDVVNDDGAAAREHLLAGRFITYRDSQLDGKLVREWPDGRRELIKADLDGNIFVLKNI